MSDRYRRFVAGRLGSDRWPTTGGTPEEWYRERLHIRALVDEMSEADRQLKAAPLHDSESIERFHAAFQALYSPAWERIVRGLQHGEKWAIEPAIVFLEAKPFCFRSGYATEDLCVYLSRIPLTANQRNRLRRLVPAALADPRRQGREKHRWLRLAESL